ncbi:MAG: MmgE/PrpD family protein [Pseudomonadota bacterium]
MPTSTLDNTPQAALGTRIKTLHETDALIDFVMQARFEDLPAQAVEQAVIFALDTLACCVAGRGYKGADAALEAARRWGEGAQARVIARPGTTLPPASAAFVNSYQAHALEWDGLHEHSVVIALGAPMGALLAHADEVGLSGEDFLLGLCIAVEVAVLFGAGSASAPKFFRPAIAGQMGAAMALAKVRGYSRQQTSQTLGLAYSMLAGTMQAHWEGAMALAMQVGQAARAAHQAADLARAGMAGPIDVIGGQFGYFTLFEDRGDVEAALEELGEPWAMTQMAHKPFPAGRATQAVLTMLYDLQAEHDFGAEDVEALEVFAPPLILTLVGRPLTPDMSPAYARLCLDFVAPLMLLSGKVKPRDFNAGMFSSQAIEDLADKVHLKQDENTDPNALGPQRCVLRLKDGRSLDAHCEHPLGAPGNALSAEQRLQKVAECFAAAPWNADPAGFVDAAMAMPALPDIRSLTHQLS